MLSGISTGMVATFVSHPLDTVKVRFQTSNSTEMTLRRCITDVYLREGVSEMVSLFGLKQKYVTKFTTILFNKLTDNSILFYYS